MKTSFNYLASVLAVAGTITAGSISLSYATAPEAAGKLPSVVTPADSTIKEKLTDSSFVEKAALSSMRDSELAKIALQKSQNKKLKKFAQKVVDGSSSTIGKLKQVASTYRLDVPQALSADHRKMVEQMQQLTGSEFDQTFADVMKKVQDTTVGLYDNAAGQATLNAELRVFANQQLPMLRQNQKLAHALSQTAPASAANDVKINSRTKS
jgi:putative membrane protein